MIGLAITGGGHPFVNGAAPNFRFGVFEVDLTSGELYRQGIKVKLQQQPFQVLVAMLEHPREVVTREELQARLWPDSQVDFDRGLNKAINRLREALGDDAENPRFIETVPQRGYRFLAPVERYPLQPQAQHPPDPPHPASVPSRSTTRRGLVAIGGGLVAVPLLIIGYQRFQSPQIPIDSIAVLPLDNLSDDPEDEYFSDGMTDEIIREIAGIESLRVISRTSVMRYKGQARRSLQEIARELSVDAIVEGTVAHSGSKVRINVQLVRAADDRHLWAGRYERDLSEILSVQDEVARSVAKEIRGSLASRGRSIGEKSRPVNPKAYEAYLKGNYLLHRGIAAIPKSVQFFTDSIELDPGHADAQAGLAQALIYAAIFGIRSSADAFPAARVAALRALSLDNSNAAAHNALADIRKGYDWDFPGAEAEYKLAIGLDPNHLLSRLWYAECLARLGRHQEALDLSDFVLKLDPVSPVSVGHRAMLLYRARRFDDAIWFSQQALDLDSHFLNAYWWKGISHAAEGNYANSISCLAIAAQADPGPLFRALLGHVYGLAGERPKALQMLEEVTAAAKQRYVSPMDFAIIHAGLGDADTTFRWLDLACESRAARMHELPCTYFDRFRNDSRYSVLTGRVGLPG